MEPWGEGGGSYIHTHTHTLSHTYTHTLAHTCAHAHTQVRFVNIDELQREYFTADTLPADFKKK